MKYYYTDPLKALWMMRNFDIELRVSHRSKAEFFLPNTMHEGEVIKLLNESVNGKRMYVNEDSYGVFEPKEGDLIEVHWLKSNKKDSAYKGSIREIIELPCDFGEFKVFQEESVRIIQRNGTAFFMPEVEA